MTKIILDAGHGGNDPGAVYEGRSEKDDVLRLVLAVGALLEENGVEVAYTRTGDVYEKPFEKAQSANREGGDFFLSIHRNASPRENQYSGVETLVYDRSGQKAALAEAVNRELEQLGFQNLGVKERPELVVLRRTKMPAALVEVGFLNTDADNERFDERFDEIAQAIANGILQIFGTADEPAGEYSGELMSGFPGGSSGEFIGGFSGESGRLLDEVSDGSSGEVSGGVEGTQTGAVDGETLYRVQVGAFRQLDQAVRLERTLRAQGYATFIVT